MEEENKKYITPIMEITEFENEDVIQASKEDEEGGIY